MIDKNKKFQSFEGQLLVSMPDLEDRRFKSSVVYVCSHSAETGAVGLVINAPHPNITLLDLMAELHITCPNDFKNQVFVGGPEKPSAGFIIHSSDYRHASSVPISEDISFTVTHDVLIDIAANRGPKSFLVIFGCCTWYPGQLEEEIMTNTWLTVPATNEILFDVDYSLKWTQAIASLGVANPVMLSGMAGKA